MHDVVTRFDTATLGKATRTPQGFLRVPANLTRVGVFEYRRNDGTTRRELRLPDEVFKADSLASLKAAPATEMHPTEMVSPSNVRRLAVGMVSEDVKRDGAFVASDVIVQHADSIAKVESRELVELSCGYRCKLEHKAGVYEGQRYDAIQRDIVYNHVALLPRGHGRAGRDVSLRLDSGESDVFDSAFAFEAMPAPGAQEHIRFDSADARGGKTTMSDLITLRLDGLEIEVTKSTAGALEQLLKKREDAAAKLVADAKAEAATLQGRLDSQAGELKKAKDELATASDPKRLDAAITSRLALIEKAKKLVPAETKFDGLTERDIKIAAIKVADEKFDAKDRDDAYIDGRFEGVVNAAPERKDARRDDSLDRTRRALAGSKSNERKDREDGGSRRDSRKDRPLPPWQRPLAVHKD